MFLGFLYAQALLMYDFLVKQTPQHNLQQDEVELECSDFGVGVNFPIAEQRQYGLLCVFEVVGGDFVLLWLAYIALVAVVGCFFAKVCQ